MIVARMKNDCRAGGTGFFHGAIMKGTTLFTCVCISKNNRQTGEKNQFSTKYFMPALREHVNMKRTDFFFTIKSLFTILVFFLQLNLIISCSSARIYAHVFSACANYYVAIVTFICCVTSITKFDVK